MRGIDLAIVTQPEDFHKQPWQAWQQRQSRIDTRKRRARCRHFRFASRSLDDWRRLGPPASAVIRTAVLHLHLETRAVEVEVSPCRVCVFGPSVGSTTCQHNGGDEENAGHRSGVVWEREERRRGCTRGGCMGKKRPQRQRSESDTPSLVKRSPRKEYGTKRASTSHDSQEPKYSVFSIFALSIPGRKVQAYGTSRLRKFRSDFACD